MFIVSPQGQNIVCRLRGSDDETKKPCCHLLNDGGVSLLTMKNSNLENHLKTGTPIAFFFRGQK
jgi:hypothetical protein